MAADATQAEELRSAAAFELTAGSDNTGQLRSYLDLFERRALPWEYGMAIGGRLAEELGVQFFRAVAQRVSGNPALAAQNAMAEIATYADRHGPVARATIADALDRAAERSQGLSERERAMIDSARAITRRSGR